MISQIIYFKFEICQLGRQAPPYSGEDPIRPLNSGGNTQYQAEPRNLGESGYQKCGTYIAAIWSDGFNRKPVVKVQQC